MIIIIIIIIIITVPWKMMIRLVFTKNTKICQLNRSNEVYLNWNRTMRKLKKSDLSVNWLGPNSTSTNMQMTVSILQRNWRRNFGQHAMTFSIRLRIVYQHSQSMYVKRTSVELSLVFGHEISWYRDGYRNSILRGLPTTTFHRLIKKSPRLSTGAEHLLHLVPLIICPW